MSSYGFSGLWAGSNLQKGLAVFCRKDWPAAASADRFGKWLIPIRMVGTLKFNLLAVWACPVGNRLDNYIGQVYRSIREHGSWLNCAPSRPGRNHTEVVRLLESCGMVSPYHSYFAEAQGVETRPTCYFHHDRNRPFHIDYVFVPKNWRIRSLQVGSFEEWGHLSDHVPVIVDIELPKRWK